MARANVRGHAYTTKSGKRAWRQQHSRKVDVKGDWTWAKDTIRPQAAAAGVAAVSALTWSFTAVMSVTSAVMCAVATTAFASMGVQLRKPREKSKSAWGARVSRKKRSVARRYRGFRDKYSPKKAARRARKRLGDKMFGRFRAWKQSQRERLWSKVHRSQSLKVVRDGSGKVLKVRESGSGRPVKVR